MAAVILASSFPDSVLMTSNSAREPGRPTGGGLGTGLVNGHRRAQLATGRRHQPARSGDDIGIGR